MPTLLIVVAVVVVAVAVGTLARGRKPDVPSTPRFAVPQQLDRADFDAPDAPWLLLLFSSSTCLSCLDARKVVESIDVADLHEQELAVESAKPIHDKYAIDADPTVVLSDTDGVVRWSYLGAPPPEAIADLLLDLGLYPPDDGTAVDIS